MIKSMVRVEMS